MKGVDFIDTFSEIAREIVKSSITEEEGIEKLNDYIKDIRFNPNKVITELENERDIISYENDICPRCATKFEYQEYENEKLEYLGSEVKEKYNELLCPRCGRGE